jgi:hypothetical protein
VHGGDSASIGHMRRKKIEIYKKYTLLSAQQRREVLPQECSVAFTPRDATQRFTSRLSLRRDFVLEF